MTDCVDDCRGRTAEPLRPIEAVVFDMGGVIVDLGPISDLLGVDEGVDQLWTRWLTSPAVRDFETGVCSVDEFGDRLVADLGLDRTGAEVVESFVTWPKGLLPGAEDLVRSLDGRVEVGLLSNTNALHWFNQRDHETIRALFPHAYLSFELAMVKPDREIFEHVASDLGLQPDAILFLDDNQLNVDGARDVGLNAELVKGVEAARAALVSHGVVAG